MLDIKHRNLCGKKNLLVLVAGISNMIRYSIAEGNLCVLKKVTSQTLRVLCEKLCALCG
jgi:hypothetical protein